MPSQDLHNNMVPKKVIAPISPAATGTISGTVIDTKNFDSLEFVIMAGAQTTTGITVTPVIKSGTVTGTLTSEADANLIGTEAAAAALLAGASGAAGVAKIGYKGSNRYVTCDLVVTAAASGVYSVGAMKGHPRKAPQT